MSKKITDKSQKDVIDLAIKNQIKYKGISKFFNEVIYLVLLISLCSLILPSVIVFYVNPNNTRIFFVIAASTGSCIISIYYIGINSKERKFFKTKLKQLIKKHH